MIELKPYTNNDLLKWDQFLQKTRNGLFFHQRNFISYNIDRFQEHSVLCYKKGKLLALFPATVHDKQIVSYGGLSIAGLLTSMDIKAADVLAIFDELIRYYREQGFSSILYKAIPLAFHRYPAQEDLYALFRHEAKLVRRDISSCIYLPERIRFSETKRQLVRKCVARGLQVSEQSNFDEFWKLLTMVVAKHGVKPTHSFEEIQLLHNRFPSQIRLFEAREAGELMAGTVIFDFGTVVHTQYMANSSPGREAGALDFLIDTLLQTKFADRRYFNFGISTEEQGRVLNTGLIQQKELMGGGGIVYDFYELSLI